MTSENVLAEVFAAAAASLLASTAPGCRWVDVTYKRYSTSGIDHPYTYKSGPNWCWNRTNSSTSSWDHRWSQTTDAGWITWDGQVDHDFGPYAAAARPSKPTSAVNTNRQSSSYNEVGRGHDYPRIQIRGYWDGQYQWKSGRW